MSDNATVQYCMHRLYKRYHLRGNHSLQIVCHFAVWDRRNLLSRHIDQATDFSASDGIKQDQGRIGQDDMPMIRIWKLAVFKDQTHETRGNIYLKNISKLDSVLKRASLWFLVMEVFVFHMKNNQTVLTSGMQSERRRFEKHPSQTIVRGANAEIFISNIFGHSLFRGQVNFPKCILV